jgi:hypothetical protein
LVIVPPLKLKPWTWDCWWCEIRQSAAVWRSQFNANDLDVHHRPFADLLIATTCSSSPQCCAGGS